MAHHPIFISIFATPKSIFLTLLIIITQLNNFCSAQVSTSEDRYFYGAYENGPYIAVGTCVYKSGNYTKKSEFESNLLNVFSNLTSAAATSKSFYNTTAGSGESQAYGLFDCKAGLSSDACLTCIRNGKVHLLDMCTTKEAIVYLGDCLLRYANRLFFSKVEFLPRLSQCDSWGPGIPDPENLTRMIVSTMEKLIKQVIAADSTERFAVEMSNLYEDQKVYMYVQCTPDVSRSGCQNCLMLATDDLTLCSKRGDVWSNASRPSCQMRYGFRPFYNLSLLGPSSDTPPRPPALPPSSLSSTPRRSSGIQLLFADNRRSSANLVLINVIATIIIIQKFIWF